MPPIVAQVGRSGAARPPVQTRRRGAISLTDMSAPQPVSVPEAIANLQFLPDRQPSTTDEQAKDAFGQLAQYRDGGVFVAHWAGTSEWERHPVGDEIVMVVEGSTTIFFLTGDGERSGVLGPGDLVVVPRNTWHRFETPDRVQLMSVTPQPTDHSATRPD
jgi:mannose-6-phosphate isomerase-like protein (cupin superfamily)